MGTVVTRDWRPVPSVGAGSGVGVSRTPTLRGQLSSVATAVHFNSVKNFHFKSSMNIEIFKRIFYK